MANIPASLLDHMVLSLWDAMGVERRSGLNPKDLITHGTCGYTTKTYNPSKRTCQQLSMMIIPKNSAVERRSRGGRLSQRSSP
jgi:hypothetical protein